MSGYFSSCTIKLLYEPTNSLMLCFCQFLLDVLSLVTKIPPNWYSLLPSPLKPNLITHICRDYVPESSPNHSFNNHVLSASTYNAWPRRRDYSSTPSLRTAHVFVERISSTKTIPPYCVWGAVLGTEDRKYPKTGSVFSRVCPPTGRWHAHKRTRSNLIRCMDSWG